MIAGPSTEEGQYLQHCAKVRDISMTSLLRELVRTIAREKLVLAVLDDGNDQAGYRKVKYARRYFGPCV